MADDKESIYNCSISPLMDRIIQICQDHRIPLVCQFQLAENVFVQTALLFNDCTDERMYSANTILRDGDPGFTTILSKSAKDFKELVISNNELLTAVQEELLNHDKVSHQDQENRCSIRFNKIRAMISDVIEKKHFPE